MIFHGDVEHGRLIARAAGSSFDPEVDVCISRVNGAKGELVGGVIYTRYTGTSIFAHMAGRGNHWATPLLIWIGFDYPFVQLKVKKLLTTVPSTNQRVLDIDRRLGFKEIYRIEGAVPDGDLILMSMSPEECKWLNLRNRFMPAQEAA